MDIIYSPEHRRQHGRAELTDGRLVPVYEHPGRIDAILSALARRGLPRCCHLRTAGWRRSLPCTTRLTSPSCNAHGTNGSLCTAPTATRCR
jgi:hypothetical protein